MPQINSLSSTTIPNTIVWYKSVSGTYRRRRNPRNKDLRKTTPHDGFPTIGC